MTWSLVGYPLLAIVNHIFDQPNSAISLTFRGLCAVAATIIIIRAKAVRFDSPLLLLTIFGVTYATQLVLTLHIRGESSALDPIDYWIWMFGACLVPSIATYLCFSQKHEVLVSKVLAVAAIAATCLLLMFASTLEYLPNGIAVNTGRYSIPSLNPIAVGHIAASTILIGIGIFLRGSTLKVREIVVLAVGITAGVFLLVFANSRGPLLALGCALLFLGFARFDRRGTIVLGVVTLCSVAYLISTQPAALTDGLLRRIDLMLSGVDASTNSRILAVQGAWDQFLGSPLIGDGVDVRVTRFYPHNVIVEALMTTGLLGGVPFIMLLFFAFKSAFKLLRLREGSIWLSLLFVQSVVAAQLSSSIYQSTTMWVAMAAVLAVAARTQARKREQMKMPIAHRFRSDA